MRKYSKSLPVFIWKVRIFIKKNQARMYFLSLILFLIPSLFGWLISSFLENHFIDPWLILCNI
jgi:hypothetical protein